MKRALCIALGVAAAATALAAPAASADVTVTPAKLQFGALPIGATSASQSFTLTVNCNTEMSCAPDPYEVDIVSSARDFTQTNDCPASPMPGTDMTGTSCTVTVTFSPVAAGPRGATISTGSHLSTFPPEAGTPGEAFGQGICSICFPGSFPGLSAQVQNAQTNEPTTSKRKCKRRKAKASAARRCKKKRK